MTRQTGVGMSPFEYAMGLISIIVGLAVSDILLSANRLIRAGPHVRWDARVILTAVMSFLLLLEFWFAAWTLRDLPGGFYFPLYIALLSQLVVSFLIAAACLPDEPTTDLAVFYVANARYLWSAAALFHLFSLALGVYFAASEGALRETAPILAAHTFPLALSVVLALRPASRWLHLFGGGAAIVFILAMYWAQSLQA